MSFQTLSAWLCRQTQSFGAAEGGNLIITFALATVPIVGFIGAAIDYSRANSVKAAMQAALDSTALMLSKDAQNLTSDEISQKASDYFNALFNRPEAVNVGVTLAFTSPQQGNFKLDLTVTGSVPTTFTQVFGQSTLNVDVNSQVLWGIRKLEVALALDNTGSMSSNSKMTNLKTAAHNLLTTLKAAAQTDGDIKVAIVPFDTTVNLGTSYKDNDWFEYGSLKCGNNTCTSSNWKNYWEGCVRDRTYPYDVQDDPPSTANSDYPVYDCGSLTSMLPLSYDWTALNSKIDAMSPNGNTNVTIGLVWAWHALTAQAPLSEAAAPAPDLDKVIIVLTDGDNTESWKNSNNTKVTSQSAIDTRTSLVCTNIKAANIRVYTVRVINGNASLLQSCATNPTMYYDVQQASQLNNVFSSIAQNLANLRIAK
jgi:Flp pilus assembly protein TadG